MTDGTSPMRFRRGVRIFAGVVALGSVATGLTLPATPLSAQCAVQGGGPSDSALAQAACDRATERFQLLYGIAPPAGVLAIDDDARVSAIESFAPEWRLVWPSSRAMRAQFEAAAALDASPDDAIRTQWTAVLPHELGHVLLSSTAARFRGDSEGAGLPDWIHEGTAVWMEPPAYRAAEMGIVSALQPFVPDLEDLLDLRISVGGARDDAGAMVTRTFYPCASNAACGGRPHWSETFSVVTRQFADGSVAVDTIFHTEPLPPPDPTAANFYAYSALLVRFLSDLGGPDAMSDLLERLAVDPSAGRDVVGRFRPEGSAAAMTRAWRGWLEEWLFGS